MTTDDDGDDDDDDYDDDDRCGNGHGLVMVMVMMAVTMTTTMTMMMTTATTTARRERERRAMKRTSVAKGSHKLFASPLRPQPSWPCSGKQTTCLTLTREETRTTKGAVPPREEAEEMSNDSALVPFAALKMRKEEKKRRKLRECVNTEYNKSNNRGGYRFFAIMICS